MSMGAQADSTKSTPRHTAVLVLGMHRSGTSALTRVINLLGADLPRDLMPAAEGNNEPGFWESKDAYRINEDILAAGGSTWADWRRFNPDWFRSPAVAQFKERALAILERDFSASAFFVLKDPRICRLLPFWLGVLREFGADAKCVLPIRNPIEVALSLHARDNFLPVKSYLLWLRHVLDAEQGSRGLSRGFLSYSELLTDWRATITALSDNIDLAWPRRSATAAVEIDSFLQGGHRHHAVSDANGLDRPEVPTWVKSVYSALKSLAADPTDAAALHELDLVWSEFNASSETFGLVLRQEEIARDQQRKHLDTIRADLEEQTKRANQAATQSSELEKRIAELRASLKAQTKRTHTTAERLAAALRRLDSLQSDASWQLMRPLRRIESKWPELVRAAAAVPKATWWALKMRLPERQRLSKVATRLLQSGLFDRDWYIQRYPEIVLHGANPVLHWLTLGWKEHRDPNPLFGIEWYLTKYRDVAGTDVNPLIHYLDHGANEGRDPGPDFNTNWYLAQYPDVTRGRMSPLEHYLKIGREKGYDPKPAATGHATPWNQGPDAIEQFLDTPAMVAQGLATGGTSRYQAMRQDVAESGLWDERWYLTTYYDEVREQLLLNRTSERLSALDFYLCEGWRRGHKPSARFSLRDLSDDQTNPVTRYLSVLRFEGYQFDNNPWIPSPERLAAYRAAAGARCATKVVYTCIVNGFDALIQPYHIDDEWDYVCFTDDPELIAKQHEGVWDIQAVRSDIDDPARNNRWHKLHPHTLFPAHDESIYIDGNINVISPYLFDEIRERGQDLLLPRHFQRSCIYDEIAALHDSWRISDENKKRLEEQEQFLLEDGFPHQFGLAENNLIYRRHGDAEIKAMMDEWWAMLNRFSSRDQASLAYIMWKHGRTLQPHMLANTRVSYRDFWMVKHRGENEALPTLSPAFDKDNICVLFSTNDAFAIYLGVAIKSLIEHSSYRYNYDIIVLESDLKDQSAARLALLAEGRANISLRFFNVNAHLGRIPKELLHVEGYVPPETYNKCLLTDILRGYDHCAYLDSDIVVLADVAELCHIDMHNKSVGASVNIANVNACYRNKTIKGVNFREYLEETLGIKDYRQYFQAGIILVNLAKLNGRDLIGTCMRELQRIKKPVFFDQCIFNSAFYGDVHFFSTAWNHVWYMQNYSHLRTSVPDEVFYDYARGRVGPKIIHYASKDKPQNNPRWRLSEHFWKYAAMTPFYNEILGDARRQMDPDDFAWLQTKLGTTHWDEPRLLAHLHLYYEDQLDYMLSRLDNMHGCAVDLFVTVPIDNAEVKRKILLHFEDAKILVTPNVGYDIYPFLAVLKGIVLDQYDYILKIHTKNQRAPGQDTVYGIKVPGYVWRDELIDALLGSREIFERNLALLQEDKGVGSISAKRFIFDSRDNNEEKNYDLPRWKNELGIETGFHYTGGTMFMARAFPFERIRGMNVGPDAFGAGEPHTKDCKNLGHVLERLFGIIVNNEGFRIHGV
jgi:lipopolysaccharide biosynthesis glycosyltransferase